MTQAPNGLSQNGYGVCLCLYSDTHGECQCATRESGRKLLLNCTASRSGKVTTDQSRTNETMVPTRSKPLRMGHPQPGAPRHPEWCCAAKQRGTSGRRRRNDAHDACRRASRKLEPKTPARRGREPAWVRVRPASAGLQPQRRRLPGASGWGCYEHPPPSTCSAQACCHMLYMCTC